MRVEGIRLSLGGREVLRGVSFEAADGLTLILGPNGAGKTTLLRAMAGIYRPDAGVVEVEGPLGYLPAEFFNVDMRVADVLLAGGGRLEKYSWWLNVVGLAGYEERIFSTLSTGEKKLVLLAKALAEGRTVLLDEPTANLDPAHKALVMGLLSRLKKVKRFIAASHDLDLIDVADSVVLLRGGTAVQLRPEEVTDEELSKTYGARIRSFRLDGRRVFALDF
ncbi:MAG: ABC transporter ATP-binding protein [Thermoproteus sp. AZ2]|jgi:iron complex transport system ATP-binding protein|uniref:ABC transporter ATP-binding protein n=1 Tax=Thermoproteus sp. AZ2 TaxID=1609232 RepID=A0ACC6V2X7_9CREN|nr:MAG: iron ABC transporter ATP-binding protein [Thermoproteus sp. AZ2]